MFTGHYVYSAFADNEVVQDETMFEDPITHCDVNKNVYQLFVPKPFVNTLSGDVLEQFVKVSVVYTVCMYCEVCNSV